MTRRAAVLFTLCLGIGGAPAPAIAAPDAGVVAGVVRADSNADRLRHDMLRGTPMGAQVRIDAFALPGGETVALDLRRFEVLRPDAQLILGTVLGEVELAKPDVVLLSGQVAGDEHSTAYLALSPYGTNGFIDHAGVVYSVSTGAFEHNKNLRDALRVSSVPHLFGSAALPPADCGFEAPGAISVPAPADRGAPTCRIANIAIDTDWEYTNRHFDADTDASAAYAVSLLGAVSEIYQRDLGVRLTLGFLRVWASDVDPYGGDNPLFELADHWSANMNDVDRNTVQLLTGRGLGGFGGNAFFGLGCPSGNGYSASSNLNGSFPYPIADHRNGNRDLYVVAHTLGHNFGAQHTHNTTMYDPPLDGCGLGDCDDALGGTIMSYCAQCPGGLGNIALTFHPQVRLDMLAYLDQLAADCFHEITSTVAVDDTTLTFTSNPIEIDALANDDLLSCPPVVLLTHDPTSSEGGAVTLLAGAGPYGRDLLRYTPPAGFLGEDSFSYTIVSGQVAMVSVQVEQLREADTITNPEPGLGVDFYKLNDPIQLPDFTSLTPYAADIAPNVNFEPTSGAFSTSGLGQNVGAVFTGYVQVFLDGVYTFTTESDEGSALFIGDRLVVDNDGLHAMQLRSGQIALRAGLHAIRIEYFEQGGQAGLIATIAGPSLSQTVLSEFILSHETNLPCSPADLAEPLGVLDFTDVTAFLSAYLAQDPEADLAPPAGVFTFTDVLVFLNAFKAGCP